MRHFEFKNGEMHAENVPLAKIAAEVGTPCYVYSTATFERHFNVFKNSVSGINSLIAYSVKANSNIGILATLSKLGAGADVVSGGELQRALTAGIPANKIVFSGVGKTKHEIEAAANAKIKIFNVESIPELYAINEVAARMNYLAPIAFRVNPDVTAGGHKKISTGKKEDKFGIAWNKAEHAYAIAKSCSNIEIVGIDVHIGSQIDHLEPFEKAISKVGNLIKKLHANGHNIRCFDIGGGLGIPYGNETIAPPDPSNYGAMVKQLTKKMNVEIIFEPGRMISGNAGILLSKVLYVKKGEDRNFLIIDAAMNDLLRPALYDAFHEIEPVRKKPEKEQVEKYDVVGPICESSDTFTKSRKLSKINQGELIVMHTAGAYGASQSSQYNTRPLIPEVLVKDNKYEVIRKRPTINDILKSENIPNWLI
ncbi:diaminopimelate decarboxylase [Hellea sp.]|nr:diaminopimelate decarboxylase [Hellea sp.]